MKTVMKKIFSLLLVAVLLVSAMPTAFADVAATATCPTHTELTGTFVSKTEPTCTTAGKAIYHCNAPAGIPAHDFEVEIPKLGHSWSAEVKSAATCSSTGLKVHTCVRGCTENETLPIDPSNHTFSNGTCTGCGICEKCKQTTCICCPQCGEVTPNHAESCPTLLCDKGCGRKAHTGFCCTNCNEYGHQVSSCDELYETCCNVAKGSAHRADCVTRCTEKRDCKNANHKAGCLYALCDIEGCQENEGHTGEHTGVPCDDENCTKYLNHDGKHSYLCPTVGCDKPVNHSGACTNPDAVCSKCNGAHDAADCPNDGDHDLKVFATMWTGDGREETVYLGTFYNLTTDTKIPEYMKENSARIDNWVAAVCSGYTWSDRKIYENKWSTDQMEWNDRMSYTDQEAYINVFRPSKDVVIFLHTGRTYVDYDWIKVEGKTTDDTLTLDEAKAIVKKYYNFTDLKMYDNDDWNEYVDGNDNIKPWNAVPISDYNVTKIHVLMSGYSAKNYYGSNSGHTADSTNPKTGDMIYAPAIVLGTSVSALAVLFYLNKKRAY